MMEQLIGLAICFVMIVYLLGGSDGYSEEDDDDTAGSSYGHYR